MMAEEKGKRRAQKLDKAIETRDRFFQMAQLLVPLLGIFTALSYFLGRLRVEAYYYALGITPHVLDFKTEDYMFSSFNLVIMCLSVSTWLYMYWRWARPRRRLVLGFPIAKGPGKERLNDILMLINLLLIWGFSIWNMFSDKGVGFATPGIGGLNAGLVIGIAVIIYAWLMQRIARSKELGYTGIVLIAILLLAWMPSITARLAMLEAKTDLDKFPKAFIVCDGALPTQLQLSPSNPNESMEVKLVITNNGMTYVLRQDDDLDDKWQIFAIPEKNINHIVYLHVVYLHGTEEE